MTRSPQTARPLRFAGLCVTIMIACTFILAGTAPSRAQEGESAPPTKEWIVTGQVLDAVGSGIPGASVQIEAGGEAKTEGRVIVSGSSEQLGDFRLKLPGEPKEKLFIRVKKERFAVFHAPVAFESDEREAFVDVEMVGAMSIRGQVAEAATCRPVKDADVTIDMQGRRWDAKTDERGRFEIRGLPSGGGLLMVSRAGFARQRQPVRVETGAPDVRVLLHPERPVRLRLVNDRGEPISNAEIELEADDDTFAATTDADGHADVHGISYESTEIAWRASHPDGVRMLGFNHMLDSGGQPEPTVTTRPAASRPGGVHTLVLPRGGKVTGKVVDAAQGEPVIGARIMIVDGPTSDTAIDWTDGEGQFEIPGIMPGAIVVAVQHPDYAPELVEDEARAGWARKIPVRLGKGKPLAGVVVDEKGKGLGQVQVVCTQWRNHDVIGLRALTDEEGRFAFEHAPDGPIEFAFYRPGGGRFRGQTLTAGKTDYRFTLTTETRPRDTAAGGEEAAPRRAALEVGKPAPDFSVTAIDGTSYRLSKLRGKYVFVDVWATWCPPCRAEMPVLKQLREQTKSRSDFVMLGISLDATADAVKAFAEKEKLTWPLVAGPDSGAEAAAEAFGVKFIPFNVLIGPGGKILAIEVHGPDLPQRIQDLAKPVEKKKP
jgi:peroxiredoxin